MQSLTYFLINKSFRYSLVKQQFLQSILDLGDNFKLVTSGEGSHPPKILKKVKERDLKICFYIH